MKKVMLRLEDLRVSSFQTSADEAPRHGTVHAAQQGVYPTAVYHSCPPGATGDWCHQLYADTDMRMCCTVERCSAAGMCW
jgi:hypothetical protein